MNRPLGISALCLMIVYAARHYSWTMATKMGGLQLGGAFEHLRCVYNVNLRSTARYSTNYTKLSGLFVERAIQQ